MRQRMTCFSCINYHSLGCQIERKGWPEIGPTRCEEAHGQKHGELYEPGSDEFEDWADSGGNWE